MPQDFALHLLSRIEENLVGASPLAISGSMTLFSEQAKFHIKVQIISDPPHRLRLTAFDAVGRTILILTVNKSEFSMLDLSKKEFLQGVPDRMGLTRFIPIRLKPAQIISIFSGSGFLLPHENFSASEIEPGFFNLRLLTKNGELSQTISYDPNRDLLLGMGIFRAAAPTGSNSVVLGSGIGVSRPGSGISQTIIEYSEFKEYGGRIKPTVIMVTDEDLGFNLKLRIKELILDVEPEAELFSLKPIKGFKVIKQ